MSKAPKPEYLAVMPRSGDKPLRHVTEAQARSLLALALVDPVCKSRRGQIVALRQRNGISVAAINAALRLGGGNTLPRAEDSQTVRRVSIPGGGVYHEPNARRVWAFGAEISGVTGDEDFERELAHERERMDRERR